MRAGKNRSCFTEAKTKKRRKKKRRKGSKEEDRISKLSDDVLCHILSFLPTEEAIAASTLSKRWRFLWTMVPALDFKLTKPTTHEKVNKFLSLRTTQRITRFHLNLKNRHCLSNNGHKWVSAAINGKVEQLNISLCTSYYESILSMSTLFTCTTIVTLKLTCCTVPHFPSSVHLPSLKTLLLHVDQYAPFPGFKNLIYGSPALELFHLKQKWDLCYKELSIVRCSRSIRLVDRCMGFDIVIESDRHYDFITDYLEGYWENVVKVKVYITVYGDIPWSRLNSYVFFSLEGICNVEYLSLSDFRVWMNNYEEYVVGLLPQFQNLVQLQLHLKNPDSLFRELPLMCPKLQNVEFVIMDEPNGTDEEYWILMHSILIMCLVFFLLICFDIV